MNVTSQSSLTTEVIQTGVEFEMVKPQKYFCHNPLLLPRLFRRLLKVSDLKVKTYESQSSLTTEVIQTR